VNLIGFCRLWQRRAVRRLLLAAFAMVCLFVVVSGARRALVGSSEFRGFREIVQVSIVHAKDHYKHIPHVRAYPPFFPIFWAPFGAFPVGQDDAENGGFADSPTSRIVQAGASATAVLVLMTALVVWAARAVAAACRAGGDEPTGTCMPALLALLCGALMLNSVIRCETDMFVVMPVAGAMYLIFARRRDAWGGALLGLAAALKLTPGLFGVYLLCRRKWRALAGMALGGLVCMVLLPGIVWGPREAVQRHVSWYNTVLKPYAVQGPDEFINRAYRRANQSLKAAVMRYFTDYNAGSKRNPLHINIVGLSPAAASMAATGAKMMVLAGLLAMWTLMPTRTDVESETMLFALVPPGMLLLSDVSVGGHLAILLITCGALAAFCFRRAGERAGTVVSWGVLCGFGMTYLIAVKALKEMSAGTAGVGILLAVTAYAALRLRGEAVCRAQAAQSP